MTSHQQFSFFEPAYEKRQLWRLVLGVVTISAVWVLVSVLVVICAAWLTVGEEGIMPRVFEILVGDTIFGLSVLLLTFTGLMFGCVLAARVLHKRRAWTLFGSNAFVRSDFGRVVVATVVIYALILAVWSIFFDVVPNLALGRWLIFLPLGLAGVALQTLAEELAFRGYLFQQLTVRFRSATAGMVGSALVFGAMHYSSSNGVTAGLMTVLATFVIGLITADLTRRTGSLSSAWAFHFSNNAFALLFVSTDGTLTGMALFLTPYTAADANLMPIMLSADVITSILLWLILVRVLRRPR